MWEIFFSDKEECREVMAVLCGFMGNLVTDKYIQSEAYTAVYQTQHDLQLYTLRKLYFKFLSNWMEYDHGDRFPFDFESNGIQFGSKSKGNRK